MPSNQFLIEKTKEWLIANESSISTNYIHSAFNTDSIHLPNSSANGNDAEDSHENINTVSTEVFFGIEGKRNAVLKFFSDVISSSKCYELMFISEENMSWLTEDKAFFEKCANLLITAIMKGNTLKIIHTVNRNINELSGLIEKWLPLHLTGRVTSYYYPKYQEMSFSHTLFIAPGLVFMTSLSSFDKNESAANYLFYEKNLIKSAITDFNIYADECKTLMHFINYENKSSYKTILNPFSSPGDIIIYENLLSPLTMSAALFKKMVDRLCIDEDAKLEIKKLQKNSFNSLKEYLKNNTLNIIIEQNFMDKINKNDFSIILSNFHQNTNISYLENELNLHIKYLINMLKNNANLNFYILNNCFPINKISILTKENEYTAATNFTSPSAQFSVMYEERNLSDAFYEYLFSQLNSLTSRQKSKEFVIRKLSQLL